MTTERILGRTRTATRGMVGHVIEVHPDGNYEIELSDPTSGVSIAQVVVGEAELALPGLSNS